MGRASKRPHPSGALRNVVIDGIGHAIAPLGLTNLDKKGSMDPEPKQAQYPDYWYRFCKVRAAG